MKRRRITLAVASLAWPSVTLAQENAKPRLVAYLNSGGKGRFSSGQVVLDELARLGWKEGGNLRFDARYSDNRPEQLAQHASELVALNPAVIVAASTEATQALKRLTDRIPIIMANSTEPVAHGFAASLARPGGNVSGVVTMGLDIVPKLVQYASTLAPTAKRLGVLLNPANPNNPQALVALREAAQMRRLLVSPFMVRDAKEIEKAVRAMTPASEYVLVPGLDALILQHMDQIATLAREAKLPSASIALDWAPRGGLLSYGHAWQDNFKRAAQLADKVLRGEPVGEIPIEQPTRFYLILNQRAAREMGIKFAYELLLSATEVIQ